MGARLQSEMRRLWFLAVLLCLWPLAAQAITRNPVSFIPEHPQKPSFSSRLERDGQYQERPSLLVVVYVTADGRIGIFCGGDPVNRMDADGRLSANNFNQNPTFGLGNANTPSLIDNRPLQFDTSLYTDSTVTPPTLDQYLAIMNPAPQQPVYQPSETIGPVPSYAAVDGLLIGSDINPNSQIGQQVAMGNAVNYLTAPAAGMAGDLLFPVSTTPDIGIGTTIYRVFGGDSRGMGDFWTTVDPATVPNFRAAAGLYPANAGTWVAEGQITSLNGIRAGVAAPGPATVAGQEMVPQIEFLPGTGSSQVQVNAVYNVESPY